MHVFVYHLECLPGCRQTRLPLACLSVYLQLARMHHLPGSQTLEAIGTTSRYPKTNREPAFFPKHHPRWSSSSASIFSSRNNYLPRTSAGARRIRTVDIVEGGFRSAGDTDTRKSFYRGLNVSRVAPPPQRSKLIVLFEWRDKCSLKFILLMRFIGRLRKEARIKYSSCRRRSVFGISSLN